MMVKKPNTNILASVIIPNWNGKDFIGDCLLSLRKQVIKAYEVIVVDNGSKDGSVNLIEESFPEVTLVKLPNNFGFARAINEGVKKSKAEFVVFLNSDTVVEENWLENLIIFGQKYRDCISVNSKLLNFFNRNLIDGVGITINEVGQARSIGWKEEDRGQYDKAMYIFGATGGASLFRRKDFLKVGMFDENYFMYSEEVDFAFRAQFLNYKSIYCPKALVYHRHKASAKKKPHHIEYWQFRNMTITIIKDFPTAVLLRKFRWLKILLVHLNTIFYQLKNGFWWAPFRADLWIILYFPYLIYQRIKIQSGRKVGIEYIENFLMPKRITYWGLKQGSNQDQPQ
ncbi:glycosyltransferase family 2 protein [Candidatus Daviesbacteria bacterium]|nr:glycosyltransferase family 2 protein [Candidatus Daviesbacteria bacterium]